MTTLAIFRQAEPGAAVRVGTMRFRAGGDWDLDSDVDDLDGLLSSLVPTAGWTGPPVARDDPGYPLAFADALGRTTDWALYAEPVEGELGDRALYDPDQPRVPAGSPEGGQFAPGDAASLPHSAYDVVRGAVSGAWTGAGKVKIQIAAFSKRDDKFPAIQQAVTETLSALPVSHLELATKSGALRRIVVGRPGTYDRTTATIYIDGHRNLWGEYPADLADKVHASVTHEFGHAVQDALLLSGFKAHGLGIEAATRYAGRDGAEEFAEAYTLYAFPAGREMLQKRSPATYEAMRKLFDGQFGEPRARRPRKLAEEAGHWVTLDNGAHVFIADGSGRITKGPKALVGKTREDVRQGKSDHVDADPVTRIATKLAARGLTPEPKTGDANADQAATRKYARTFLRERLKEIAQARGVVTDLAAVGNALWDDWKDESTSSGGLALQLAAEQELGVKGRLTPAQVKDAEAWTRGTYGPGGRQALRAYVRGLYETTQHLLRAAQTKDVTLYRAVILPRSAQGPEVAVANGGKTFRRLPDMKMRWASAASWTVDPAVANSWEGIEGVSPAEGARVVLRARVPAAAVLSVPLYGRNVRQEREVVVLGTSYGGWDAWRGEAPEVGRLPLAEPKAASKLAEASCHWLLLDSGARVCVGATHAPHQQPLREIGALRRELAEPEDECTWRTINGNPVCIREGHGSHGTRAQPQPPRIFRRASDVEQYESWGGEKPWRVKGTAEGTTAPLSPAEIPETLYHVTTRLGAIRRADNLLGHGLGEKDSGLGGNSGGAGVSFTGNRPDAELIQRELTRAIELAKASETDVPTLLRGYARQDEGNAKLPAGRLDTQVAGAIKWYESHVAQYRARGERVPVASLAHDTYNSYLTSREGGLGDDAVANWRTIQDTPGHPLKNPILYGDPEVLAKLSPDDVAIVAMPKGNLPAEALVRRGSDDFLDEVRVHADVPLKGARLLHGAREERHAHETWDGGLLLAEEDDCTWRTINGHPVCITGGHGEHGPARAIGTGPKRADDQALAARVAREAAQAADDVATTTIPAVLASGRVTRRHAERWDELTPKQQADVAGTWQVKNLTTAVERRREDWWATEGRERYVALVQQDQDFLRATAVAKLRAWPLSLPEDEAERIARTLRVLTDPEAVRAAMDTLERLPASWPLPSVYYKVDLSSDQVDLLRVGGVLTFDRLIKVEIEREAKVRRMNDPTFARIFPDAQREIEAAWQRFDEAKRLEIAKQYDVRVERPIEPPKHLELFTTGSWGGDPERFDGSPAGQSRRWAHAVLATRLEQVAKARGLTDRDGEPAPLYDWGASVWGNWKNDSASGGGLALQLAAEQELGARGRLTKEQVSEAKAWLREEWGERVPAPEAAMRGYVRGLYDTTQYLLREAGIQDTTLYRAVMLDETVLGREVTLKTDFGATFRRLPELGLQWNGAASWTADPAVANAWEGIGGRLPAHPTRVVLRGQVPARALLSIPVYGENMEGEQEAVVAGLPLLAWDAWHEKAPIDTRGLQRVAREPDEDVQWQPGEQGRAAVIDLNDPAQTGDGHWLARKAPRPTKWDVALAEGASKAEDEDCRWVTLDNGVHVCIGAKDGTIRKGPKALVGKTRAEVRTLATDGESHRALFQEDVPVLQLVKDPEANATFLVDAVRGVAVQDGLVPSAEAFDRLVEAEVAELRETPLIHMTSLRGAVGAWEDGLRSRKALAGNLPELEQEANELGQKIDDLNEKIDEADDYSEQRELEELRDTLDARLADMNTVLDGKTMKADEAAGLDRFVFATHGDLLTEYGTVGVIIDPEVASSWKTFATPWDIVEVAKRYSDNYDDVYKSETLDSYAGSVATNGGYLRAAAADLVERRLRAQKDVVPYRRAESWEVKTLDAVAPKQILGFLCGDIEDCIALRDEHGIPEAKLHYIDLSSSRVRNRLPEDLRALVRTGEWPDHDDD